MQPSRDCAMRWANRQKHPSSLRHLLDVGIASLLRSCRMGRLNLRHTTTVQHRVRMRLLRLCHRQLWRSLNLARYFVIESSVRLQLLRRRWSSFLSEYFGGSAAPFLNLEWSTRHKSPTTVFLNMTLF